MPTGGTYTNINSQPNKYTCLNPDRSWTIYPATSTYSNACANFYTCSNCNARST